jgi:pimeloyl-ACP methyl ester carboxylesterase
MKRGCAHLIVTDATLAIIVIKNHSQMYQYDTHSTYKILNLGQDFIQNKERLNIENAAKKITIPHLIIHGDKDTSISVNEGEKLHTWNPKSILKIIEKANHVFNVSHPWIENKGSDAFEKTVKICIDFLRQ